MGNYDDLKNAIADVIYANGNNEITGTIMQQVLQRIVSVIGANATFAGIATPQTNPGEVDQNVIYVATQPGTYTNFNGVIVTSGIGIFSNKSGAWEYIDLGLQIDIFKNISYSELVAIRNSAKLTPGMRYRITDYVTTTTQANTQSAGHPFDVIVLALSESELSEQAWAIQSRDADEYFISSNLSAWQIWYCLDNDTSRFAWADATNGKGVIYRMVDEWNNDCPYDFKNIQFLRGVYDGGGIAPDGDEDMTFYLFTFSFRTENNEIIDTSIFGNNGRLLNDEAQISGVYGNVIGQYMDYDGSIENPTKTTQRLNDIVFYSHYDYDGNTYYGCYLNSFGGSCHHNSFGNSCYRNSFGNYCYLNIFGNDCYSNIFGNDCYSNIFGNVCYSNMFGNDCNANIFGDACYCNSFGNYCYENRFSNDCNANSFGNYCYLTHFGNSCYANSFGNSCYRNSFGNYCKYNKVEDGVTLVELENNQTAAYNQQVQNYHFTRGLNSQIIEVERNRAYETTVAIDSSGNVKQFCIADIIL